MTQKAVVIVDYGMGNVLSVRRAFEYQNAVVTLTDEPDRVANAERLILPGVGAFGDCMKAIEQRGLVEPVMSFIRSGRPFLGICVGMQILMDAGDEFGGYPGLGLFSGRVVQISSETADGLKRKIPHIGWTPLDPPAGLAGQHWSGSILDRTPDGTPFYFVHSFTAAPTNPADVLARADYAGANITAAIRRDNVTGVQFHPEKSGPAGLALIERFLQA